MYTAEGKFNKNSIIEQYYPLVRRQAFNLKVKLPAGVDVDDLIQAGVEGLLSCVDRFDPDSGVAFSTYAHQRIRGAMIDELRSRDWLPRSVRRSGRELEQTIRRLEQQLGRVPQEREIATELGMELNEYHQLLLDTNNGLVLSYDEVVTDTPNAETNGDEEAEPEAQIGAAELKSLLVQAIDSLPEREKLVMTLYYQEELNLKEIGAVLDVTESRVSQLHSQAIKRIRARVAA
jgi:RNA polymerase sigma factor for flagellar operon FliA